MTFGRLPAYSGATVPALHRLPVRNREGLLFTSAGERSWWHVVRPDVKKLLALAALAAVTACSAAPASHNASVQSAQRIISLVPSLTEDLCAVGAAKQLVGVSSFSEDIPCAKGLPQVNNFASIDSEAVLRLRPALVIGIPAQRAMAAPLQHAGIPALFMKDDSYDDLFADIAQLGKVSGHEERARRLSASLRARTQQLRAGEHFKRAPSVFFVEQALPLWTVGPQSYIATLIQMAGGRLATQSLPRAYAQYSTEALARLDPDAIVASGDAHLDTVLSREPWRSLRAVREHHVFILQNAALLVRPGPRYNEGLSWLIERLRPLAT